MSLDLIRYYFYIEDEAEIIRGFQSRLLEHDIISRSFSSRDIEEFSSHNCFLHNASGKIKILIVRLLDSGRSSTGNEALLQDLEATSDLTTDSLLGKVTVWAGYNEDYTELKTVLGINRREAMQFKINGGSLYRLSFYWPQGHARYICVMSEKNTVNEMFLAGGLPLIEAELLQLHLIVNLYRDRNTAIDKQNREFEKKLSVILHTDLVSKQSQSKQVDDLEEQLNELAKSYGITAGNKNVLQEGINQIKLQLEGVTRRIRIEKALLISLEEIDRMVEPFKLRLDRMVNTSADLENSLKSHQAAINVVESKVDIMNSRQNIATQEKIKDLLELNSSMQKQSLIFQISAAAIEFIVIAYYSHSLWKNLSPGAYHAIPGWLQLLFVLLFSGNIVYCTHLIGEYIQDKKDEHVKKHLLISLVPLSVLLLIILVSSFLFGN